MSDVPPSEQALHAVNQRLQAIDEKLDTILRSRTKSMEWIATLSEHVQSLDAFREEVRASFEPFVRKLEHLDDIMRILRHAASDLSRRLEKVEKSDLRKAG